MGMYASATLSGDLVLELEKLNEKYDLGYPVLYLRSFISESWMEFGGKVQLNCSSSKVTSSIVFHTKPFYGGKAHHVTAEIKGGNGSTVCKVTGDWNTSLELCWLNGLTETLLIQTDWLPKKVRPLHLQKENESQKLWLPVRQALAEKDYQSANEKKKSVSLQILNNMKYNILTISVNRY